MIEFTNVRADFPIYNSSSRSLKKAVLNIATGGKIVSSDRSHVVIRAIDNISFKVAEGERVGLVGPNGAGKSTLLRLLVGVYKPTAGNIEVQGSVKSLIDIGLEIDNEATGRQNIFLRAALMDIPRSTIESNIDEIIEFSDLGQYIDMPVRTYSSGMHLRLAFSVTTFMSSDVLLMDEWLSVGDAGFRKRAEAKMNNLIEQSKILVVASHSKELLEKICTRIIWLEHGAIKMDGGVNEVLAQY